VTELEAITAPPHDSPAAADVSGSPASASGGAVIASADPGRCSVHGERLRTAKAAGIRSYRWGPDRPVWCPYGAGHEDDGYQSSRARCLFCGGPLVPPGTQAWMFRSSRAYCSTTHRNYYWRWLQRQARDRKAARR
jgi:hypothetical protein